MKNNRPLIVMTASPHLAPDPQIPLTETKRFELCQFLFDNQQIFKDGFRFKASRGLHAWINGGYKSAVSEEHNERVYQELATWSITSTAYPGQLGGLVELANEIVSGQSKVLLFFIANGDQAGISSPANQALTKICDYMNVPIYFNHTSASFWAEGLKLGSMSPDDYRPDNDLVRQEAGPLAAVIPFQIKKPLSPKTAIERYGLSIPISHRTLALISHDDYKESMRSFVLFFERTLQRFGRIITTGTTGTRILELVPSLKTKLLRYESGPKGGDIRIAFEILAGICHDVVFFMDPLHPHPHAADIRVLTLACNQAGANLITNQTAAKDWIHMLTSRAQRKVASAKVPTRLAL